MTTEQKILTIDAYRDAENNPCCARDFATGEVCPFYMTHTFGTGETCFWAGNAALGRPAPLHRRKLGEGTLIPHENCPIWNASPNLTQRAKEKNVSRHE